MKYFHYIVPVLLFICLGCNKRLARKTVVLSPITVSAKTAGLNIYRASEPRIWDVIHTRVRLSFNLQDKTANGKAYIDVHPYFYSTDTLQLDAKGMQIDSVLLISDNIRNPLRYSYEDDKLTIRFGKTYITKDSIRLCIQYKAMPYGKPNSGGSAAIADDRGLYFINTDNAIPNKPAQIWSQGETQANSRWLPTIDVPNERFTTQLELIVPDSFVTLSNGGITAQVDMGNGMRMDIWRMEKPIQTYAVMFAMGNFAIVKDEWKRREVSYYVEPEYAPYARLMFSNTPEMIEYYSKITGLPYPWNKYSQVVVRDYVSGAMENTTASLFGEFMNQDARENADKGNEEVVSHELFHQWFGDYVTAESWSNLTLNESFATYGEQLWHRYKYGRSKADELAYDDLSAYLSAARSKDPSLVRYRYADREEMFDRISYQKGGLILNYLHGLIGDDAFFKAMQLYLTQNALKTAEASQWRLAVEEATGQDWNWFFNQWYYRGGHPQLDIKYFYNDIAGKLVMTVNQKQDSLYILPLKAELIYGKEKTEIDWKLTARRDTFVYSYKNGQRPVVVADSRHWLVGTITENKEPKDWLAQYTNSPDNMLNKRYAIGDALKKLDDTSSQAIFNLALGDKEPVIRDLVLASLYQQTLKKWQDKWQSNVAYLAANDANNNVRATAFDVLGQWKISTSKEDMYAALNDSSYMVAGAALNALNELAKDTAYTIAKNMLPAKPRGDLQTTIWEIIAERGNDNDIALFEKRAPYFYGTKKISFVYSISTYLLNVKDYKSFERALAVQEKLIATESIKTYRSAMVASMFQTASNYKDQLRDARTNVEKSRAQQKLDMMKTSFERIIKEEKEEESKTQYTELLKAIYN